MNAISPRVWKLALLCLTILSLAPLNLQGVDPVDQKEVLRQARAAYYSLKTAGMTGLHCQVNPDWSFLEKIAGDDQAHADVLPVLRQVHFNVAVGADGDATVTPQSGATPQNADVAERTKKMIEGFEQIITGFFQTWQGFVINSTFPEAQDAYQLEDLGDQFKITYRQGSTDVQMTMDHKFAIREVIFNMPQANVILRPRFSLEGSSYVLAGYDFVNALPSGEKQQGNVTIQTQKIEGLVLPTKVGIKMMIGTELAEPAFDLTAFEITMR
jgi:hypothetical protein